MKHLIYILAICVLTFSIIGNVNAQVPNKISYQGLLTTSAGTPVPDGSYDLTFKIFNVPAGGSALWTENQTGIAVHRGTFNVFLGSVTTLNISFNQTLYVEVTATSGPGIPAPITFSPRSELTSSPYAMRADTANFAAAAGSIGGSAGGDLTGTYPNPTIAPNAVTSPKILDGTITGTDIASSTIGTGHLNFTPATRPLSPGVSSAEITDGAVTQVKIASGVTLPPSGSAGGDLTGTYPNPTIAASAVTTAKLADGSVNSAKILDGAVATVDMADGSVTSTKILDGTILFSDIGINGATANQVIKRNPANTAWIAVEDETGWKLTGNAGTVAGTNFVGTTDAQAFDIRTNNVLRTRITTKGQIETYNTGQSVFVGEGAGASDDLITNRNVFVGYQAGFNNTTGSYNTANGFQALFYNTEGYNNTANGFGALFDNTEGYGNTANGIHALSYNTKGSFNTANGYQALYYNATGNYNTALGHRAFYSGTAYSNSTALGNNTAITASNQVRVGNSSVTSIGGQVGWTTLSDGRFKKDINETMADGRQAIPGLAFIMKLRPVTYYLDMDKIASFLKTPDSLRLKESEAVKSKILQTGFVAQEVEKAAQELGYDFSGVDKPKNENDYYGLRYAEFTVPLVKAVQELYKQNKELIERVAALEAKVKSFEEQK